MKFLAKRRFNYVDVFGLTVIGALYQREVISTGYMLIAFVLTTFLSAIIEDLAKDK